MIRKFIQWVRSEPLASLLLSLFGFVLVAFVATMFCAPAVELVGQLLGLSEKNEILQFLGIGMGGLLVALQAVMSYKRAQAMEETAGAQARVARAQADANVNAERGQRQERLKNAIEHLGSDSVSVRLGGAYELFHLAKDFRDLGQTVLDILCAHIRRTTRLDDYQDKHASEPSEEVQSLLTLLFVEEHRVFEGLRGNLEGSFLNGACLAEARLAQASLRNAGLRNALLAKAQLQESDLGSAHLQGADLRYATLQGATLWSVELQGAFLRNANLQGDLMLASLQNAHLVEARLQGADLRRAGLQGADLSDAELQGARLDFAQLQGASLNGAAFQGVDSCSGSDRRDPVTQIRDRTCRESDLSTVTFSGGLTQEKVEALTSDLSDDWAEQLRARLEPHVGKPENRRPPDGVDVGTYTEAQAENWIAEYKKAVAESHGGEGRAGRSR